MLTWENKQLLEDKRLSQDSPWASKSSWIALSKFSQLLSDRAESRIQVCKTYGQCLHVTLMSEYMYNVFMSLSWVIICTMSSCLYHEWIMYNVFIFLSWVNICTLSSCLYHEWIMSLSKNINTFLLTTKTKCNLSLDTSCRQSLCNCSTFEEKGGWVNIKYRVVRHPK